MLSDPAVDPTADGPGPGQVHKGQEGPQLRDFPAGPPNGVVPDINAVIRRNNVYEFEQSGLREFRQPGLNAPALAASIYEFQTAEMVQGPGPADPPAA